MRRSSTLVLLHLCSLLSALCSSGCRRQPTPLSQNLSVANKVAPRIVLLYYEGPDMLLAAERRNVELPENAAAALSLVTKELIKGSVNAGVPRLFPTDTVVRGAYLVGDTAFVDIGGDTLKAGWGAGSHTELMAVYSVVQTVMANFPEAKRVRLLVNGEQVETLAGHINLTKALVPMKSLVATR